MPPQCKCNNSSEIFLLFSSFSMHSFIDCVSTRNIPNIKLQTHSEQQRPTMACTLEYVGAAKLGRHCLRLMSFQESCIIALLLHLTWIIHPPVVIIPFLFWSFCLILRDRLHYIFCLHSHGKLSIRLVLLHVHDKWIVIKVKWRSLTGW